MLSKTIGEKLNDGNAALTALLTYANGVTGAADTNIGNAVKTLADGYDQGGGVGSVTQVTPITDTTSIVIDGDYGENFLLFIYSNLERGTVGNVHRVRYAYKVNAPNIAGNPMYYGTIYSLTPTGADDTWSASNASRLFVSQSGDHITLTTGVSAYFAEGITYNVLYMPVDKN